MSIIKGKIEASITLSPSTCYYMRTGICSLDVVTDYYVSTSTKTSASELMYCPRLYRAMCNRERLKPISVTPCECGHAEVISGHQRACIANKKHLELTIQPAGSQYKESCPVCQNDISVNESKSNDQIVTLNVCVNDEDSLDK